MSALGQKRTFIGANDMPAAATGGTTPTAASCDGALLIWLSLQHSPRSSKHLRVEHVASYSPIISAHHLVADVEP